MVQINFATREVQCKVVYYGPAQSGKTANLQSIHDKAPAQVHGNLTRLATDTDRTLFFDFLPLDLGALAGIRTKVQLYGVPYIEAQNAVRVLVLEGVDAVVFVADSDRSRLIQNVESLRNLEENLGRLGRSLDEVPLVFQWNKSDCPDAVPPAELEQALNTTGAPAFTANALNGTGVFRTLKAVTAAVLEKVTRGETAATEAPPAPAVVTITPEENSPPRPKIVPVGSPGLPDAEITSVDQQEPHWNRQPEPGSAPTDAADIEDPLSAKLPVTAPPAPPRAAPMPPEPVAAPPPEDDPSSVLDTPWGDVVHNDYDREPVTSDDLLAEMQAAQPVEEVAPVAPVAPEPYYETQLPVEEVYEEPEPAPEFDDYEAAESFVPQEAPEPVHPSAPRRHYTEPFAAEMDAWSQLAQPPRADEDQAAFPTPVTDRRRRARPVRIPTVDLVAGSLVSMTSLIVIGYLVHLFL